MLDTSKLHPMVASIIDTVRIVRPEYPISYVVTSANIFLSMMCAANRFTTILDNTYSELPLNYYAFNILDSGHAKDETLTLLENSFFDGFMKIYAEQYNEKAYAYNSKLEESATGSKAEQKKYVETYGVRSFSPNIRDTTYEGIVDAQLSTARLGFGYTMHKHGEFLDWYANIDNNVRSILSWTKDIFYGNATTKVTKGNKRTEHIKGLPHFLWFHSSASKLNDSRMIERIRGEFDSGLTRRSFFCYPDPEEYGEKRIFATPEDRRIVDNQFGDKSRRIKDKITDLYGVLSEFKNYTIWEDGQQFSSKRIQYARCGDVAMNDYRNYIAELYNKNEVLYAASRPERVVRLAAVYALLDNPEKPSIKAENIEQAKYIVEYYEKYVDKVVNYSTEAIPERIFKDLKSKSMTDIELMKRPYFISQYSYIQQRDAFMTYVARLAKQEGYELQISEDTYTVKKISANNLEHIAISVSDDITVGFNRIELPFTELHTILKSDVNYSPSFFINGYRKKDNYMGGNQMIILDIDDGLTLEQAKAYFGRYKCLIATTKSHQIAKGGRPACDRFRVILPTSHEIVCDANMFSDMMANIMSFFACGDPACKDPSRFYYPYALAEHWYSDSDKLFDARPFIKSVEKVQKTLQYDRTNGGLSEILGTDKALAVFGEPPHEGFRSSWLWRAAFIMLRDPTVDLTSAESEVWRLNNLLPTPLKEYEVKNTIINQMRRLW